MLLGIEIGGTKLQIVRGDNDGNIVKKTRVAVDKKLGGEGIRKSIQNALEETGLIQAVGVGFGGPVDWKTGRVCCSHQIEGWSDFELGHWLWEQDVIGTAVAVENDANTACLGEALRGAGQGRNPVFYVTLGSGVGGG